MMADMPSADIQVPEQKVSISLLRRLSLADRFTNMKSRSNSQRPEIVLERSTGIPGEHATLHTVHLPDTLARAKAI